MFIYAANLFSSNIINITEREKNITSIISNNSNFSISYDNKSNIITINNLKLPENFTSYETEIFISCIIASNVIDHSFDLNLNSQYFILNVNNQKIKVDLCTLKINGIEIESRQRLLMNLFSMIVIKVDTPKIKVIIKNSEVNIDYNISNSQSLLSKASKSLDIILLYSALQGLHNLTIKDDTEIIDVTNKEKYEITHHQIDVIILNYLQKYNIYIT